MDRPTPPSNTSGGAKTLNGNAPAFVPANTLNATAAEFTPPFRKEIYGGVVEFGPGAAVVSVKLPADCSSVQIIGLKPAQANIDGVAGLLAGAFGLAPGNFSIELREISKGTEVAATVKFDDSKTAQTVANQAKLAFTHSNLTVKEVIPLSKPSEWVQLGAVKVSWEKTGRMAFVEYRSNTPSLDTLPTTVSQILTPSGRRIKCVSVALNKYESGRALQSFSLNNIDTDADSAWVENTLVNAGFPAPKKVKIKEVNREEAADDDECVTVIEAIFKSIGPLESFHPGESVDGARKILTAIFCNPEDAGKAVKTLRDKKHRPDGLPKSKNLTVEPMISMKVNIPNKIATALDSQLQALQVELRKDGKDMLKIVKDTGKPHTLVRFTHVGDDALAVVAKTKARIEKLLAGTVVTDTGIPLWHPWFAVSGDAGDYLNWLSCHTKVYVHRSVGMSHLILYGGKYEDRRRACMILKSKVQGLMNETAYTIRPVGGKSIADILETLKPVFGGKVRLSSSDGSSKIKLCGSVADVRKARMMLSPGSSSNDKTCVICWDQPSFDDTVSLPCGHIYCRECFIMQFQHQNQFQLPLTCSGICSDSTDEDKSCKHRFEIKLLREELPFQTFDTVLKLCLDMHIRAHPDEFSFCPTRDCKTIYRPIPHDKRAANRDISVVCTTCLSTICTSCRQNHSGLTCTEYIDAMDGQAAVNRYKAEEGIKDSPYCRTPVEKRDGCNHIHCVACGTHFCWVCMHISADMQSANEHLFTVHGTNGLPNIPPEMVPDLDAPPPAPVANNLNQQGGRWGPAPELPRDMVHEFPPDMRLLEAQRRHLEAELLRHANLFAGPGLIADDALRRNAPPGRVPVFVGPGHFFPDAGPRAVPPPQVPNPHVGPRHPPADMWNLNQNVPLLRQPGPIRRSRLVGPPVVNANPNVQGAPPQPFRAPVTDMGQGPPGPANVPDPARDFGHGLGMGGGL